LLGCEKDDWDSRVGTRDVPVNGVSLGVGAKEEGSLLSTCMEGSYAIRQCSQRGAHTRLTGSE
jgi:hypothetical protein